MSREHLIYDNHARRAGMRVRKCFVTIDIANAKMATMFFTAHVEQGLRSVFTEAIFNFDGLLA